MKKFICEMLSKCLKVHATEEEDAFKAYAEEFEEAVANLNKIAKKLDRLGASGWIETGGGFSKDTLYFHKFPLKKPHLYLSKSIRNY